MNLSQIRAALHGYVHRTDQGATDNEPLAIELARVVIARQFFPREASAIATVAISAGVGTLPPDYGSADAVLTVAGALDYATPRDFAERQIDGTAGGYYTVTGSGLLVGESVHSVQLVYFAKPAELVSDGSSSWLSVGYPDVLLYQAIAEQQRYLQDWEQAATAENYAVTLMGDAMRADKSTTAAGGSLRIKGR